MKIELKILIIFVSAFVIFGCRKQGCTDEFALNYDVSAKKEYNELCIYKNPEVKEYVPSYGANTATLATINRGRTKHVWKVGTYYSWSYTLAAKFHGNNGEYRSAGLVSSRQKIPDVSINGFYFLALPVLSDNSYLKNVTVEPPAPFFSFPDTLAWKATGDVWPAFEISSTVGQPDKSKIISDNPSIESSYNFKVNTVSNADSLALEIIGQRKHIVKVIHSSESSHVFSQEEIESVGRGNAVLRVVSLRYGKQIVGGKTYYMLNQKRSTKEVFIE